MATGWDQECSDAETAIQKMYTNYMMSDQLWPVFDSSGVLTTGIPLDVPLMALYRGDKNVVIKAVCLLIEQGLLDPEDDEYMVEIGGKPNGSRAYIRILRDREIEYEITDQFELVYEMED